jgi:AraC-like DNA-binding protein
MTAPAVTANGSFHPRVLPVETLVYRSDVLWIGRFRCPAGHPLFADSGPASAHLFVFPRTSVRIRHQGREPFLASPNLVTFYNPGDEYRREPVSAEGDHCDWFAVAPEVAAEVVGDVDARAAERPPKAFRFTHGPSDSCSYLEQRLALCRASRGHGADALYTEEAALRVLGRLVRGAYASRGERRAARASSTASERRQREVAEAAQGILARRFAEPLSLAEIAGAVGSSVYHLCRLFRRATGTSLHAYRNQLRLRRSLAMLGDGEAEITDVALELGYSSHSHFTFAFRRAFGATPAEFRRAARGRGPSRRPGPMSTGT